MKSRNFPHNHRNATDVSATKGFFLANESAPQGDVAAAVRRFELQHNQSPQFARRRQERRKGQALLLAVLIMLLAALLSAGFLAVVSGNLNQSARIADKSRAIEASRAGIAYANAQLSGSAQGDLWRPIDVSPAPNTNDATYNFYYSQLEKVQGWAAKRQPDRADFVAGAVGDENFRLARQNYFDTTYGKFPDPGQVAGDAPKFLVKVREVPADPANPDYEADHVGEIKITSIGLAEDDPNVFHRAVAYKEGRRKSPFTQALRSISNWDFVNNTVPQASISAIAPDAVSGTTKVTVLDADVKGAFPTIPYNIVLSHKDGTPTNSRTFGGVVTTVTPVALSNPARSEYTITGVAPTGFVASDTMQVAAAIGTGANIDLLNTGAPTTFATTFPDYPQPNGILSNGSLWLQNQVRLSALNKNGTKLFASGSIALDANKTITTSVDVATQGELVPSSALPTQFPGTFVTTSGVAKTDLVNDGWDKIGSTKTLGLEYTLDQTRTVEPFTPPRIDSATNLARYRALTRNSLTTTYNGIAYQNGVYIDNRDDVEKVGTVPMSRAELVNMLVSPPAPAVVTDYSRTGTATAVGTVGTSLEQKHLRGWVGPDEFLARGALIEILQTVGPDGNAPSLRVTLDARSDSTAAAPNNDTGPDNNKAFRKVDGTPDNGVYTKILPWPANGTIFAEGNIRIRGDAGSAAPAPRSLTVISQNNIYIEGSVSVDSSLVGANPDPNRKKLMLLAKKNVIVNPTRTVLARTDVQTVTTNTAPVTLGGTVNAPQDFTINVADALPYNAGDFIEVAGPTLATPIRGLVTVVDAANKLLTINSTATGVIPIANTTTPIYVRSPLEPRNIGAVAVPQAIFSLVNIETAINRRVMVPVPVNSTDSKLLFDHVGELKATEGLTVKSEDIGGGITRPGGFTATLANKQVVANSTANPLPAPAEENDPTITNIAQGNKKVRIYNNFTTGPKIDEFQAAGTKTLTQFATEISLLPARNDGAPLPDTKGYKYTATATAGVTALPSFTLTGIGLRYNPGAGPAFVPPEISPANNRREDINTPTGFTIPLATTVEFDLNGAPYELRPIGDNAAVRYIGFNPAIATSEDAITIDRSFYQTDANVNNSTLDIRNLKFPALPQGNLYGHSIVMKRSTRYSDPTTHAIIPNYRVRGMKLQIFGSTTRDIQPVGGTMNINAFVYAQEGSWLVIPGDYFRSNQPVRGLRDNTGKLIGSYIDYSNPGTTSQPDPGEFILSDPGNPNTQVADLNRNGKVDTGELEAALQFVRYNSVKMEFFGAIVENQSAIVADVVNPAAPSTLLVKGAVADWMNKWASYTDVGGNAADVGKPQKFNLISYTYDPSLASNTPAADQLRVPVTDELLYQQ